MAQMNMHEKLCMEVKILVSEYKIHFCLCNTILLFYSMLYLIYIYIKCNEVV